MYVKTVSELLGERVLHVIPPNATVQDACTIMSDHNIGALPVVDNGRLVGILSEKDVIHRCISGAKAPQATRVAEVMTRDPETVDPDCSAADAISNMMAGGFRHLPVCKDGSPVGMVAMRDMPAENRLMAERYRDYPGIQAVYG
ncbi:CBS domain-containing protein [Poseidonocella sedimentorum]|uniref:CBS domain-containing protein n=2 Tax=Poseidonocella sedimentorum TaxID=871652 RepID=A0A1I6E9N4_9RHOB|nr:CBS domain-containing protein [Poseidonocella sedimentorum]